MAITKSCSVCGETKPLADFYRHPTSTHGRRPECKRCRNQAETARRRGSARARRLARDASQRWRYRMSPADREALLAAQDGRCAICHEVAPRLAIDHDHSTGAVRGILCDPCNMGLGHFRDNPELLAEAIRYLGATELPEDIYPLIRRNTTVASLSQEG